jgi:hypothetical protein
MSVIPFRRSVTITFATPEEYAKAVEVQRRVGCSSVEEMFKQAALVLERCQEVYEHGYKPQIINPENSHVYVFQPLVSSAWAPIGDKG